jgi:hypothetical protein
MIELPRMLARQFRALFRKSVLAAEPRGPCPFVLCRTGKRGLTLSCCQGDVGLRYLQPGRLPAHAVALPATVLAEVEGRDGAVVLHQTEPTKGRATWDEAGVPRSVEFETVEPDSLAEITELGKDAYAMPAGFLNALAEAARTTRKEVARYALSRIQLRGKGGLVIATDGRQLLLQGGFTLPWVDDVLIPSLPAFFARELPAKDPIRLGRSGEVVLLEVGPWLLSLRIATEGRYPDVAGVIPKVGGNSTRLHLHPEDVEVLARSLPRLPGREEDNAPVTLQLGQTISIRAGGEKDGTAEVVLGRSRCEGPPVTICTDRKYLLRASQLGFPTVTVVKADRPLLCQDGQRTYLWMPLEAKEPSPVSNGHPVPVPASVTLTASPAPQQERMETMASRNGHHADVPNSGSHTADEPPDLLAEAEALRVLLQDGVARVSRLIAALRQHRKQTRAVQSALGSLRRLQQLEP